MMENLDIAVYYLIMFTAFVGVLGLGGAMVALWDYVKQKRVEEDNDTL